MRERRRNDWVVDLAGRHELEGQVSRAIRLSPTMELLGDHTSRFDRLDFRVRTEDVRSAGLELKAKWQPYKGWSSHRPDVDERDLFILDELALRRIVTGGAHAHLMIYDRPCNRWVAFGVPDLVLAPKARVVRQLQRSRPTRKGKVLLDLTDGRHAGSDIPTAIGRLAAMINETDRRWTQVEPWPSPHGAAS